MGRIHRLYARRAAPLMLVVALAATGLAQPQGPTSPTRGPPLADLQGWFSVNYWYSSVLGGSPAFGGKQGVLDGLTFGTGLQFRVYDVAVELAAPYLSVTRQDVSLAVRSSTYTGNLEFRNVPPATADDDRQIEFSLRQSLRFENLPNLTMSATHTARGLQTSTGYGAGLGDSYRGLAEWLPSLRWNVDYRFGRSAAAGLLPRNTHSLNLRLQGDVLVAGRETVIRPALTAQYRWMGGATPRFSHQYRFRMEGDSPDRLNHGVFELGVALSDYAATRFTQSLSYSSKHFDPITLDFGVDLDQQAGLFSADYRLGIAYPVTGELTLGAGYRGLYGPTGPSNGAQLTATYRYAVRPLTVSSQVTVDLQMPAAGGFDPSGTARLNVQYRGEPLTLGVSGSLTYATRGLRGRIEASAEYGGDLGGVSFQGGLQLASSMSIDVGVSGHVRIYRAWALQGDLRYRADFADDARQVFTVGLGLRYEFGGSE